MDKPGTHVVAEADGSNSQQLTTFSDSTTVTEEVPQRTVVPSIHPAPIENSSIVDFLSRPFVVDTGFWTSAQASGTILKTMLFPLALAKIPSVWSKLQNFSYLRCGVKIGIRLNGTKMHFGQIMASWSPAPVLAGKAYMASGNIISLSGNRSFYLTPSENETFEFTMPYSLPFAYINLKQLDTPVFDIGGLDLIVHNVLGGPSDPIPPVAYTVYASLVDITLVGPTTTQFLLPTRIAKFENRHQLAYKENMFLDPKFLNFQAQGKTTNADGEQEERSLKNVISGVSNAVSDLGYALSPIPVIGSIANSVGEVAGTIGSFAKSLGLTLPSFVIVLMPILYCYGNVANTHGLNDTPNLGVVPSNKVACAQDVMGSFQEEMSLKHMLETPSLHRNPYVWSKDLIPLSIISSFPVSCVDPYTFDNTVYNSIFSYVCSAFQFWRGSIKYHMQVVCSNFHSGRLRITWLPNISDSTRDTDPANAISRVIDIQSQTDFTFTVPYMHHLPWLDTHIPNGKIVLSIDNSLTFFSDPVPDVYINWWISAGEDFQLARPTNNYLNTKLRVPISPANMVAEGLTSEEIRKKPAPALIPMAGAVEHNLIHGEELTHIKDVILRPCQVNKVTDWAADSNATFIYNLYGDIPEKSCYQYKALEEFGDQDLPTYLDYFRLMFRYMRGGYTVRVFPLTTEYLGGSSVSNFMWNVGNGPNVNWTPVTTMGPDIFTRMMALGNTVSPNEYYPQGATIPYYNNIYSVVNSVATTQQIASFPCACIHLKSNAAVTVSAADDLSLGFIVGIPALIAPGAAPPPPPN